MALFAIVVMALLSAIVLLILMGKKPTGYPPDSELVVRENIEEDRVTVRQKDDK